MTEKLQKIIKEEIAKLPKENQEVINAFDWVKITEEIGKKYLLGESEIGDLQVETILVLVGLEEPDSYTRNIENEVGTSRNEATKIAEQIFQKIFIPINDVLVENIKKSEKMKDPKWDQNLDFILSGGNYSSFLEKRDNMVNTTPTSPLSGGTIPPRPDKGEVGRGF